MALFKTSTPSGSFGFTIMEILVVLGIFALLAGFALVVSIDAYRSHNFRSEQEQLLGVLLKARSQSVNNINQKPHGVHLDSATQYTLFEGNTYATRDAGKDIVFSKPGFTLGGATELIFSQLTGQPNVTGYISLDDHIHPVYKLCINGEGQINAKATCS